MYQYENILFQWNVDGFSEIISASPKKSLYIENKRTGLKHEFMDEEITFDGEWLCVEIPSDITENMVGDNDFETWWEMDGRLVRDSGGTIHIDKALHDPRRG